jgi:hypothetical protein
MRVKHRGYVKSLGKKFLPDRSLKITLELEGDIPIEYTRAHPLDGVRLRPSTPTTTAQSPKACQGPGLPSDSSSSLTPALAPT